MPLRSFFCQSVIAGLCLLYLPSCGNLPEVRARSSFAALTNELPPQSHSFAKQTFEKTAQQVADLIRARKFSEAEKIINSHIEQKTSTRGGFYYPISVIDTVINDILPGMDDQTLMILNQWVEESPESILPWAFRANYFYEAAWEVRGSEYINKTPEENLNGYRELMDYYIADIDQAYAIAPNSPIVILEILNIAQESGADREDYDYFYNQSLAFDPFLSRAYLAKSRYLLPKWSGSQSELFEFMKDSIAKAPRGTALPLMLPRAHEQLCSDHGKDWREYIKRPEVWADIDFAYTRLLEDFPKAGLYAAWYAETAADVGKYDIARKYIQVALEREPNHPKVLKIKSYIDSL